MMCSSSCDDYHFHFQSEYGNVCMYIEHVKCNCFGVHMCVCVWQWFLSNFEHQNANRLAELRQCEVIGNHRMLNDWIKIIAMIYECIKMIGAFYLPQHSELIQLK